MGTPRKDRGLQLMLTRQEKASQKRRQKIPKTAAIVPGNKRVDFLRLECDLDASLILPICAGDMPSA